MFVMKRNHTVELGRTKESRSGVDVRVSSHGECSAIAPVPYAAPPADAQARSGEVLVPSPML